MAEIYHFPFGFGSLQLLFEPFALHVIHRVGAAEQTHAIKGVLQHPFGIKRKEVNIATDVIVVQIAPRSATSAYVIPR